MAESSIMELPKTYDHAKEKEIYALWEKAGAFKPATDANPKLKSQPPFVIAIPPPNVTGSLHMGHALNNTIQDILIRRSRLRGVPTLWIPGTDHAGIATQNMVEKQLAKEGLMRQKLGRKEFKKRIWQWVDQYGNVITDQLKQLGCSCDWSRQRFTLDKEYTQAVQTAFKHYRKKGLIYQGERVINWCVRCQTALSDIELEHPQRSAKLYYFKYTPDFPLTIATTRPETKLGDTAVAVNPADKRYQKLIGQTFAIKFAGLQRSLKIIADPLVDPKFGTGALGVTPAHSLTDAEMAVKNDLPSITVIDQHGQMTAAAGEYQGLKTAEAREKVLAWLKAENLLTKEEDITHNLSVCYRCDHEIEPQPSKQWFLKMRELAQPAIAAVEKGEIKFVPSRWKKVYLDWMKNLRDWCVSRQIWWGHPIPGEDGEDVLDTWFSSALWPFATLGWPDKTPDLAYFYPTSVLSTARDIIYLWVTRMIFSSLELTGEKPFSTVYIHPTIFNKEGQRMSKSLGTGVDPLELIERYGADAVRFGLAYINTGTQDLKFDEEAIKAGQKFANKIWNVARFVITNLADLRFKIDDLRIEPKTEADREIITKLEQTEKAVDRDLDQFRFGQAAHALYDFIWHDLADVYIEKSKSQLADKSLSLNTCYLLLNTLATSLNLLHPFMPFVTEAIWQELAARELVKAKLLISNCSN